MSGVDGFSLRNIAARLGGKVERGKRGEQVVFPTPGHSKLDRGSVLKLDPAAPRGFVVNCFNGDWRVVREYVFQRLNLTPQGQRDPAQVTAQEEDRRRIHAEYERARRLAKGLTKRPHSESLTAQAREAGVHRSTLYRRRAREQV